MEQRKQLTLLILCYEYSGDDINLEEEDWKEARHLVKIFDNYAIEFVEWCNSLINRVGLLEWKSNWSRYNTTELLEIFKKEKGL